MLNKNGILDKRFLLVLVSLILMASAPSRTRAAILIPGGVQSAPAVAGEEAAASQTWKYRLEFRELNLQLVGVATLQDQASCFIKSPGSSEQMIYTVGDVIGGYRIASIDAKSVSFERQGAHFPLFLGQSSGAEPVAASPDLSGVGAVAVKLADARLKTRTQKFATAKLIEDASAIRKSMLNGLDGDDSPVGRSLFAADFSSPLKGELTSHFGYRRHPLGGGIRYHRGIDIAAPDGTPIRAAASGRIVAVFNSTAHDLGRHILIKHNDIYETCYGHLSRILVSMGQWVQKGDIIGREGSTGSSTGPHLHFEIHRNKAAVNPLAYLHLD